MTEIPKLSILAVLKEGFAIGIKNGLNLLFCILLWVLTIWIPYINVGTTIAISTLPVSFSKGEGLVSPLFIFDKKYRQFMGDFFTLNGLKMMSLLPAYLFCFIPGVVISISWSLSLFILIDKEVAPGEALVQSNRATQGHKWTIFLTYFVLIFLASFILSCIGGILGDYTFVMGVFVILLLVLVVLVALGCNTVFYKKLYVERI